MYYSYAYIHSVLNMTAISIFNMIVFIHKGKALQIVLTSFPFSPLGPGSPGAPAAPFGPGAPVGPISPFEPGSPWEICINIKQ